jgi:hypothetical protein
MIPPRKKGYTDLLMSPQFVVDRFRRIIDTYGYADAESGRRFRREREAWICAIWALGLREITQSRIKYWIEIETRGQTPDCIVQYIQATEEGNHRHRHPVEVAEWETHRDDVLGIIEAKCKKQYPKVFCLLVLARNGRPIQDVGSFLKKVRKLDCPFGEAWIIGRESPLTENYTMFKILPNDFVREFDVGMALKNDRRSGALLELQKRSKSTRLVPLGSVFLPLPISW